MQYTFKGVTQTDKDGAGDTLRRDKTSQMREITILHLDRVVRRSVKVSPINVIKTINVIPTINVIKIDHKYNTNGSKQITFSHFVFYI